MQKAAHRNGVQPFLMQLPASILHVNIIKNILDTDAEIIIKGDGNDRMDICTVFFIHISKIFCIYLRVNAVELECTIMSMIDLN